MASPLNRVQVTTLGVKSKSIQVSPEIFPPAGLSLQPDQAAVKLKRDARLTRQRANRTGWGANKRGEGVKKGFWGRGERGGGGRLQQNGEKWRRGWEEKGRETAVWLGDATTESRGRKRQAHAG
jgi:hypothetical protein